MLSHKQTRSAEEEGARAELRTERRGAEESWRWGVTLRPLRAHEELVRRPRHGDGGDEEWRGTEWRGGERSMGRLVGTTRQSQQA